MMNNAIQITHCQAPAYDSPMDESQFLSQFKANLNARRISLGLEITDVHQGLLERGFQTASVSAILRYLSVG